MLPKNDYRDWRNVNKDYEVLYKEPEEGDLIYYSYVGVFTVDDVLFDGGVIVIHNGKDLIVPPNYYRVIQKREEK